MRDAIVNHSGNGVFAIRQGDWKLIQGLGSGGFTAPARVQPTPDGPKGQLYNLAEDISETNNLYLTNPDVVARLTALLEQCRQRTSTRVE
jgi:arylsulfatase A-like enzyme